MILTFQKNSTQSFISFNLIYYTHKKLLPKKCVYFQLNDANDDDDHDDDDDDHDDDDDEQHVNNLHRGE